MAKLNLIDWSNKSVGEVEASSDIFEAPVRKDILHSIVRWQLAGRRQGTHQAKTRAMVSGGGKKPFKQKGTGNARQGSTRSPLLEGGGVIFGPKPRDYSFSIPKKVKRQALKSALSYLQGEGRLRVVDSMESKDGKTKSLKTSLDGLDLRKALLIDSQINEMFARASKNLPTFKYITVAGVNVFDLLKYDNAIITKSGLEKLEARINGDK
ncbi:MAG: 50S ribosomal protein L4 [Bdellovibrionales bacterium]|nr:50S ribosomal protein L4 [Bdellovibrionales bacterium]